MVGARAYNYIKPLQIASLLWVGANAHPYNSEVGDRYIVSILVGQQIQLVVHQDSWLLLANI